MEDRVHIEKVLPREGIRMADEAGLIIMDILLQLSDGSRVNVEMQKLGLYFPGERSSCYAADAIMRQYTELKNRLKERFSYREIKPFYLIILMEHSSTPFKQVAPAFIHTEQSQYDSGAAVTSLFKIKYISLDTFKNSVHNISNRLQAWLTFFSSDEPADIIALITAYPEFRELYREIAEFRTNPKELIHMYSEALAIADRNTIRLMIDDMQEELATLTDQVAAKNNELATKNGEIAALKAELDRLRQSLQ
ncbi:MAG: Rpn family recombination-promoting nuclease/putative transposase [Clostridium sp.]|nr:Rpn family recombination-promoting nuclease/putative transposase [Acetatifactor muris]MCM1527486.1 Rpn family recombination-promoting nuclease/putative transposase [Bacteroides sp.]MCM1562070.1 Rpn family recombination-promoting nuclease/putative transposase [Clostridium sp.]